MAFCSNCGMKLEDSAKFCQRCGCAVASLSNSAKARQQEFSGRIYKCPNCGEVLKSFTVNCPACGLELRSIKATNAVKEFALKLEAIESKRDLKRPFLIFKRSALKQQALRIDSQKINLIQNFSVPNTKEDILEFMILATANINTSVFGTIDDDNNKSEKAMAEAWLSKVKQTYKKARSSYSIDADFSQIASLYNECIQDIKKQKKKRLLKYVLLIGWIPLLWILLIGYSVFSTPKEEAKEIKRLENIVIEVQAALEKGEYNLALITADSIDYQKYDKDMERKWDIQREFWVDKVLEVASENGTELDYIPNNDVDNANH